MADSRTGYTPYTQILNFKSFHATPHPHTYTTPQTFHSMLVEMNSCLTECFKVCYCRMPNLKPKRHEIHRIFTAEIWLQPICAELEKGLSLYEACGVYDDGPSPDTVLKWVKEDPDGSGARYSRAREIGYLVLADRIAEIASQTHAYTMVPLLDAEGNQISDPEGNPRMKRVLVPLNSDVIAHKRLQIDTLKWKLSKMLPKIYGDKVTQEHTGPGGGPIPIAAVNLRNLRDDELEQMQQLMSKAARIEGG